MACRCAAVFTLRAVRRFHPILGRTLPHSQSPGSLSPVGPAHESSRRRTAIYGLPDGWRERNSPAHCSEGLLSPSCSSSRDVVDLITASDLIRRRRRVQHGILSGFRRARRCAAHRAPTLCLKLHWRVPWHAADAVRARRFPLVRMRPAHPSTSTEACDSPHRSSRVLSQLRCQQRVREATLSSTMKTLTTATTQTMSRCSTKTRTASPGPSTR